ncbi:PLD nuclease N-terminal domain-containing protein [Streptomyces pathocidini]|uniref:PLD nuclease N-terminal domain-containing protein n=1 Tax=Streptomyces pathocidini TaxID=1650571 RepID=UPI0033FC6B39
MLRYLPFLLVLGLWIYAFIDCLNTPEEQVRKLPKGAWVLIIVLFGYLLFGSLAWLLAGRPRRSEVSGGAGAYGAARGRARWVAPDDNPEFLKSLERNRKEDEPEGAGPAAGPKKEAEPEAVPEREPEPEADGGSGPRDNGPDENRS